jgi:hypothetical protein
MPSVEYADNPRELRNFAILQWVLTAGFFVLLFWMLGGTDAHFPPYWLAGALIAAVVVGAVLAERAWQSMRPLPAHIADRDATAAAIGQFAKLTVRKLIFCEVPLLIAVLVAFVTPYAGWPLVIGGFPGLLVLALETWPSLRNTSMAAAMLDAGGAESKLVESFLHS